MCSRSEERENGGHFGIESKKVPEVHGTGISERWVPTEGAGTELCLFVVKTVLCLVDTEVKRKSVFISRLVFDANFDKGELPQYVNCDSDCRRVLDFSRDKDPAGHRFTQKMRKMDGAQQCPEQFNTRRSFYRFYGDRGRWVLRKTSFSSREMFRKGGEHPVCTLGVWSTQNGARKCDDVKQQ